MLAGCASYQPAPLSPAGQVLAPPDTAVLSRDAQTIDRPFLAPQAIDLGAPLTPNALAVIAVLENPDLKAQRAGTGVTDAQAFAARLLPDPSFQANFDKLLSGPDIFNGFGAQLGLDLNQLRTARVTREAGEQSKQQVRLDLAWAEWNTAGQARLLGVRVQALTRQLAIAQESAAAAERLFASTQRAAGRGDVSGGDLDARRQALVDATDKARSAERDLASAQSDLNQLLGLPPGTVLQLAPPASTPVPPSSETLVAQALDRRLDLQALRAGYGVAEADLHKAVLEQFPNLSLTLAGARDTANNYTAGPAIGFTLPLWNRNRGNIAIAKATREQLRAEYDARLFQTRAEIDAAVQGLALLRRQREALVAEMPAFERHAAASERAMKRGDLALATAETTGQALRDRRLALLQLDQQIAEQTIALELLSGGLSEGWTR
ncbi:outer membrane protein TolC [Novosphingobium sp. PhB165]|uniref:TolC family protein n=1 Tax=Novosphingobium sp. PhB165 TaxID=2485105 RepID=UPI00104F942E|nr:TolC family protein [Novosphingobium sp. PhB165]TCM20649.1 outer membrane protein TolC [Novosphingobium sp. PhB165]